MTYALRSSASLLAGIALFTIYSAASASAEDLEFSIYGGYQTAPHSGVDVSDGTSFTAGWEGKSFGSPPYYAPASPGGSRTSTSRTGVSRSILPMTRSMRTTTRSPRPAGLISNSPMA